MTITHLPSGRPFSRALADAKQVANELAIPRRQALDIVSRHNGSTRPWHHTMRMAKACDSLAEFIAKQRLGRGDDIASFLGLDELDAEQQKKLFAGSTSILAVTYSDQVVCVFRDEQEAESLGLLGAYPGDRVRLSAEEANERFLGPGIPADECHWDTLKSWMCRDGSGLYHLVTREWWDILTPQAPLRPEDTHPAVESSVRRRLLELYSDVKTEQTPPL